MRVIAPGRVVARTGYGSGYTTSPYMALPLQWDWVDVPDYFRQITNGNAVNDVTHAKVVDQLGVNYTNWPSELILKNGTRAPLVQVSLPDKSTSGDLTFTYWPWDTVEEWVEINSPNYKGKNPRPKRKLSRVRYVSPLCGTIRMVSYGSWQSGKEHWLQPSVSIDCLPTNWKTVSERVKDYGTMQTVRYSFSCKQRAYTAPYTFTDDHPVNVFFQPLLDDLEAVFQKRRTDASWTASECASWFYTKLVQILREHGDEIVTSMQVNCGTWQATVYPVDAGATYPTTEMLRQSYLLDEDVLFGDRIDPLLGGRGTSISASWINNVCQHALLEACNSLPSLSDNSISNLIELISFIKALVVDHKIEMPKSLSDAWLQYRYVYQTTKMDVQDAIKFVNRHIDLGTLDRLIVGRGTYSLPYRDSTVVCRCSVEVTPTHLSKLKDIWRALCQYGLAPDFYVIWDMIPYSFMVDWFLPISDLAGVWDANALYFSGEFYKLSNICYSITYTREIGDYLVKCYTRWAGSVPEQLNSFYWLAAPSASSSTVAKRVLDAASIFIGF